jgi:hypothetical protein
LGDLFLQILSDGGELFKGGVEFGHGSEFKTFNPPLLVAPKSHEGGSTLNYSSKPGRGKM